MKIELNLSPQDNKKLANLCGPLDENISQISVGLDVKINRKNSSFVLNGDEKKVLLASQLLESIYLRATRAILPEDIQLSLVELNQKENGNRNDSPQLHTLKADLQGRTPMQVSYLNNIQSNDINFGIGPAGTGKTYLAVASAVDALNKEKVKRIVLVRPAVEAGEKLGFLPGDLSQKVDPYLRPLYDALYEMLGFKEASQLIERNIIEVVPLAFMRGRTLNLSLIHI